MFCCSHVYLSHITLSLTALHFTCTQLQSYLAPDFIAYCIGLLLWMVLLSRWMLITTPHSNTQAKLQRLAWGVSGGSITGLQNFLKDALTILKTTGDKHDAELYKTYTLALFFLCCAGLAAFGGFFLLTLCMKRYSATYSASMFVGSFVLSASFMSAIKYHTFQHLHSLQEMLLYPTGLLFLLTGTIVLARDGDGDNETVFAEGSTTTTTEYTRAAAEQEQQQEQAQTTADREMHPVV